MGNLTEPITGAAGGTPTVVQGQGIAGTPAGGVVTVQGTHTSGAFATTQGSLTPDGNYYCAIPISYDGSINPLAVALSVWGNSSQTFGMRTPAVFKPLAAVAIATEVTIWTPAANKKFRLMGGRVASSVVGNVTLRDNTAGTIIAVVPCGVAGVAYPIFGPNAGNGILSAAANNVLTATGPALATLSGTVFGTEE